MKTKTVTILSLLAVIALQSGCTARQWAALAESGQYSDCLDTYSAVCRPEMSDWHQAYDEYEDDLATWEQCKREEHLGYYCGMRPSPP